MTRRHASRLGLVVLGFLLYSIAVVQSTAPVGFGRTSQFGNTPPPSVETPQTWLRNRILKDCPALGDPAIDDWTRVRLLRQWAWQHIPWCSPSILLDQKPELGFYRREAPEAFACFLGDAGGVWCGGAAYALAKLYALYGYQAWTYDYGLPDVMTHVTTVVRIHFHGRPLLVVQDATFNLTYTDAGGDPLDLAVLLKRLEARQADSIVIQGGTPGQRRPFLVAPGEPASDYWALASERSRRLLWNGLWEYRCGFPLAGFERKFGAIIGRALRARGLPGDLRYLLIFPQQTSVPELKAELAAAGLPLPRPSKPG